MRFVPMVFVTLASLVLLSAVPLAVRDAPYGYYHPDQSLAGDLDDPYLVHAHLPVLDPDRDALLVIAPRLAFSPAEVETLRTFLYEGGHVLVADEEGAGRTLLDHLDAGIRLSGVRVSTPVQDTAGRPFLYPVGAIAAGPFALRSPTIVDGSGDPLLISSPLAWRDLDADGVPDLGEPQGTWTLAAMVPVGEGLLVVAGSPDLLLHEAGKAMLDLAIGDRRAVLDEGHRTPDAVQVAPWLAGDHATWALVVAAALATGLHATRLRLHREPRARRRRIPDDPSTRSLLEELP